MTRTPPVPPRRGATMVAILIMLPVLLLLASMAINLAYIQCVNAQVQVVADVTARAAGSVYVETNDESQALAAAQDLAALNPIRETVVPIEASDLEFGLSERGSKNKTYSFKRGQNGNSVRITTGSFAGGTGPGLEPVFPAFGLLADIRARRTAAYSQTTLDVAIIVDRSGSMKYAADEDSGLPKPAAAPDDWSNGDPVPPNSRWLDLVTAVDGFCQVLDESAKVEKVAICGYANDPLTHQLLTDDYGAVQASLDAISSEFHGGYTNVGGGILEAVAAVSDPKYCRPWATNALVLMSDGNHNTGTDPIVAAQTAADEEIPIYTVSFSTEANQALMQQIADMTGGSHYYAVDGAALNEAFRMIAKRLPSMLTE